MHSAWALRRHASMRARFAERPCNARPPVQLSGPLPSRALWRGFSCPLQPDVQGRGKRGRETRILVKRGACRRERLRAIAGTTKGRAGNSGLLGGAPIRPSAATDSLNSYTEDWPLLFAAFFLPGGEDPGYFADIERSTTWGHPSSTVPLEARHPKADCWA